MKQFRHGLVIATILSLFLTVSAFSQTISRATLRFATDEYRLTAQQVKYLDSFAATLRNIPDAYAFLVSGHTDSVGSGDYNKTLSYNRAVAVATYLKNKGFKQAMMKLEAKGFTKPVTDNTSEINKERNRRVEIEFHLELPEAKTIAGIRVPSERLEVNESGGTVITSSGTRITVPANAFVDANGNPVQGKVDIGYTEYRDPLDFLLSGIPMHYNNGKEAIPFNSAGMFTINASQGDAPVFLAGGKRVNVGFNYDGTVREVGFYRWDADRQTWTMIQPLTATLMDQFKDYMLWEEDALYPSVCAQHNDLKQVFFVQAGQRFSVPGDSGIYRRYEAVKLNDLQERITVKQKLYERKAKLMLRKYQVNIEKKFLARTGFKLDQARGKRDKSSEMLESITFKKNFSNAMIDSLERMLFDDYAIQASDSGLSLVLYKGVSTVTIQNITIKQDKPTKGFKVEQWISDLEKNYRSYKATATRYRDTAKSYARQCDFYRNQMYKVFPLSWSAVDSLKCFRQMHDGWMNDENKALSLADWLLYYHNHKESFASIYANIAQTDAYIAMEKKVQRFYNLRMLYYDPAANLNLTSADVQLPGNFSLTSLGTYNCDQLQRLEEPVMLYTQYTNTQGKEIRPVIALLIDSKLNGILRYDGNYGLSPYRIAFSPTSTSRMVLIDGNGLAYLVKPDEFSNVDLSLAKKNSVYTFVAEPIGKAGNKKELRDKLSM